MGYSNQKKVDPEKVISQEDKGIIDNYLEDIKVLTSSRSTTAYPRAISTLKNIVFMGVFGSIGEVFDDFKDKGCTWYSKKHINLNPSKTRFKDEKIAEQYLFKKCGEVFNPAQKND